MPPRSKIETDLSPALRAELDRRLAEGGFGGYQALTDWLRDEGFEIGRSAVHVYGQALQRRLESVRASTQAAREIAALATDEADDRSGAIISIVQSEIFNTLLQLQEVEEEQDQIARMKLLNNAAKNIATLTRASVTLKRYQGEVAQRARAAADAAAKVGRAGGLSDEAIEQIRAGILGIVG